MRGRLFTLCTIAGALLSASCPGGNAIPVTKEPAPSVRRAPASSPLPVAPSGAQPPITKPATPTTLVGTLLPAPAGSQDPKAPATRALDPALADAVPPELQDDGSDDVKEVDAPPPKALHDAEELGSIAKETWVFAEPHWKARRIGYLRAGAVVARSREAVTKNYACSEGWYRVLPKGYVCVGATATLNVFDPVVEASARRPRRDTLPYTYVMSRFPTPPLYARLPAADELARVETDLASHLRKAAVYAHEPGFVEPPPADPVPNVLLYGRPAPGLGETKRSASALLLGHAMARSGFALLSTFDHEGRRYGLTTELAVLPVDRTRVIKPSAFHGIRLLGEATLPVAFVRSHHASRFVVLEHGGIAPGNPLGFREAVPIVGGEKRIGQDKYYAARDGSFISSDRTVRVDRAGRMPAWAEGGRKWIDISILRQSLVAYEGPTPVYVTLVSTGADGVDDPKTTHSTIQGAFLIHTKHISVTMDEDRIGDAFDFRDVPFVQYFTEGYALHAAYWHDEFGTPRSHGCVNLAPIDAAWLFNWTTPEVPDTWHAALSLRKGTLVYIHP